MIPSQIISIKSFFSGYEQAAEGGFQKKNLPSTNRQPFDREIDQAHGLSSNSHRPGQLTNNSEKKQFFRCVIPKV